MPEFTGAMLAGWLRGLAHGRALSEKHCRDYANLPDRDIEIPGVRSAAISREEYLATADRYADEVLRYERVVNMIERHDELCRAIVNATGMRAEVAFCASADVIRQLLVARLDEAFMAGADSVVHDGH